MKIDCVRKVDTMHVQTLYTLNTQVCVRVVLNTQADHIRVFFLYIWMTLIIGVNVTNRFSDSFLKLVVTQNMCHILTSDANRFS